MKPAHRTRPRAGADRQLHDIFPAKEEAATNRGSDLSTRQSPVVPLPKPASKNQRVARAFVARSHRETNSQAQKQCHGAGRTSKMPTPRKSSDSIANCGKTANTQANSIWNESGMQSLQRRPPSHQHVSSSNHPCAPTFSDRLVIVMVRLCQK